jgi:hypothetical protein
MTGTKLCKEIKSDFVKGVKVTEAELRLDEIKRNKEKREKKKQTNNYNQRHGYELEKNRNGISSGGRIAGCTERTGADNL